MNTILFARSPPAGFSLCPKSSNKQGEELMNDIFENTETMKENEHTAAGGHFGRKDFPWEKVDNMSDFISYIQ